mmetsp:Transcript_12854/g.28374  ORF Transcript_12854/g.28374 Transcript_12854/m.28374 type:complete len:415 (+) Transcript_12854:472-1716(+)
MPGHGHPGPPLRLRQRRLRLQPPGHVRRRLLERVRRLPPLRLPRPREISGPRGGRLACTRGLLRQRRCGLSSDRRSWRAGRGRHHAHFSGGGDLRLGHRQLPADRGDPPLPRLPRPRRPAGLRPGPPRPDGKGPLGPLQDQRRGPHSCSPLFRHHPPLRPKHLRPGRAPPPLLGRRPAQLGRGPLLLLRHRRLRLRHRPGGLQPPRLHGPAKPLPPRRLGGRLRLLLPLRPGGRGLLGRLRPRPRRHPRRRHRHAAQRRRGHHGPPGPGGHARGQHSPHAGARRRAGLSQTPPAERGPPRQDCAAGRPAGGVSGAGHDHPQFRAGAGTGGVRVYGGHFVRVAGAVPSAAAAKGGKGRGSQGRVGSGRQGGGGGGKAAEDVSVARGLRHVGVGGGLHHFLHVSDRGGGRGGATGV